MELQIGNKYWFHFNNVGTYYTTKKSQQSPILIELVKVYENRNRMQEQTFYGKLLHPVNLNSSDGSYFTTWQTDLPISGWPTSCLSPYRIRLK